MVIASDRHRRIDPRATRPLTAQCVLSRKHVFAALNTTEADPPSLGRERDAAATVPPMQAVMHSRVRSDTPASRLNKKRQNLA
jgi:hypothetical protein